jgi:hypothetical protein
MGLMTSRPLAFTDPFIARGEVDDDEVQYEVDFLRKGDEAPPDCSPPNAPLDTMLQSVSGTGKLRERKMGERVDGAKRGGAGVEPGVKCLRRLGRLCLTRHLIRCNPDPEEPRQSSRGDARLVCMELLAAVWVAGVGIPVGDLQDAPGPLPVSGGLAGLGLWK